MSNWYDMIECTKDEKEELKLHPLGSVSEPLSLARLELRRGIARKYEDFLRTTSWWNLLPDNAKELFNKYPYHKFYGFKGGGEGVPRRVFALWAYPNHEEVGVNVVTCHFGWINNSIGGVRADRAFDLCEVERWNENALLLIESLQLKHLKSVFSDPLGWMVVVGSLNEEKEEKSKRSTILLANDSIF